jgi:sulfite reductase (ferredoxin)
MKNQNGQMPFTIRMLVLLMVPALLAENQKTNHKAGIIDLFDTVFVETNKIQLPTTLKQLVFQIRDNEPTQEFAQKYRQEAIAFETIEAFRAKDLQDEK